MSFLNHWILTVLLFLPAAGGVVVLAIRPASAARRSAIGFALATFCLSLFVMLLFHRLPGETYDYAPTGFVQMQRSAEILPAIHLTYRVAIDGLSLPFVLLTSLLGMLVCVLSGQDRDRPASHFAMILWLEFTILGVFLSIDFLMLWTFLALSLIPGCVLLPVGDAERGKRMARVFLIPELICLACLFVAALGVRLASTRCFAGGTLDLVRLAAQPCADKTLYLLALIAFLIRLGTFPVHSWIVAVSRDSSPGTTAMLIGLIPLTGGYGLLRVVMPLFPVPAASLWWVLAAVGVITILYCSANALGQEDSHVATVHLAVAMMGFVCVGVAVLTPAGANGAAMILITQCLIEPFMVAISAVAERDARQSRLLPLSMTVCLAIAWLAELVVPGLLGQFMVLLGAFQAHKSGSILIVDRATGPFAIGVVIAAMLAGIGLMGMAGVRTMRRLSRTDEFPSAGSGPTLLIPIAMTATLSGIFLAPFCLTYIEVAIKTIFRTFR